VRGTTYAIAEIIWWMVAALAIGIMIGWLLRRWFGGGARLKNVQAELEAKNVRYAELSGDLGGSKLNVESLNRDLAARAAELEKASGELIEVRTALAESTVAAEARAGRLAGLEAVLAERDAQIGRLEASRGPAIAGVATPMSADLEGLAAAEESSIANVAPVAQAPPPWSTSPAPAGVDHTDDLTVINGIGAKTEKLLNGLGIRAWEQLAVLGPDGAAEIEAALEDSRGRIESDQWVEQAIDLVRRFPDPNDRPDHGTYRSEAPS